MSTFSLADINSPSVLDGLLPLTSAAVSTRTINCQSTRVTTTSRGITTVRRTFQFSLNPRGNNTSTWVPSSSVRDFISGFKMSEIPSVVNTDGSISYVIPEWKTLQSWVALGEVTNTYGDCMLVSGGREVKFTLNATASTYEVFNRPSQYEFFVSNPFPADWSLEQIAKSIEDGVTGSCLWVFRHGMSVYFAVTPERVLRDVRKFDRSVRTIADLQNTTKVFRNLTVQLPGRIANIFPRLEIVGNRLVNTSIINSQPWQTQKGVKSTTGQTLEWSWVIGLFNDAKGNGPWSNTIGPSISNIERSDWEFIPWDNATEFELIDSDNEIPRIDVDNKKIYFSSKRRTIFTIQLRQQRTDKGEDYIGYTTLDNFYTDSLAWLSVMKPELFNTTV